MLKSFSNLFNKSRVHEIYNDGIRETVSSNISWMLSNLTHGCISIMGYSCVNSQVSFWHGTQCYQLCIDDEAQVDRECLSAKRIISKCQNLFYSLWFMFMNGLLTSTNGRMMIVLKLNVYLALYNNLFSFSQIHRVDNRSDIFIDCILYSLPSWESDVIIENFESFEPLTFNVQLIHLIHLDSFIVASPKRSVSSTRSIWVTDTCMCMCMCRILTPFQLWIP